MKNIHILPTDKPSRLFEIIQFNLSFDSQNMYSEEYKKLHKYKNKNIYITSDETIKEGDWVIDDEQDVFQVLEINHTQGILRSDGFTYVINICKKIILTTDQDLIKDGVQAIDDDFIEWFVKNPSCEEVEVVDNLKYFNVDELRERHLKSLPHLYSEKIDYKIIIPKEEICSFCDRTGQVVSSTTISRFKTCDCKIIPKEESKQETLKEAKAKLFRYSEEEVLKLVEDFEIHLGSVKVENMLTFKKWFELKKKK